MLQGTPQPSDWPAWVQAVGSVAAILASVRIAAWQARKTQAQTLFVIEQQGRAEYLRSARTLVEMAKAVLKVQAHVAKKLCSRESIGAAAEDRLAFDWPEVIALERALNQVEIHRLPAELVSLSLILAATVRQFRIKVEMALDTHRQMDAAAMVDFQAVMQEMAESLRLTVSDLEGHLSELR